MNVRAQCCLKGVDADVPLDRVLHPCDLAAIQEISINDAHNLH